MNAFINKPVFLNKCLSPHLKGLLPHVAIGDKTGQLWLRSITKFTCWENDIWTRMDLPLKDVMAQIIQDFFTSSMSFPLLYFCKDECFLIAQF